MKYWISLLWLFCGCLPADKIKSSHHYWPASHYACQCPAYQFSMNGQQQLPLDILNYNHLSLAAPDATVAIEKSRQWILEHGGSDFLSQITLESIAVTSTDSIEHFKNKRPFYNLEKCGNAKYFIQYVFEPASDVAFHFGVTMDHQYQVISPAGFPNQKSNPDFAKIVSPQKAFRVAWLTHPIKMRNIAEASLIFNPEDNRFLYEFSGKIRKNYQRYTTKCPFVLVDANTARVFRAGTLKGTMTITPNF